MHRQWYNANKQTAWRPYSDFTRIVLLFSQNSTQDSTLQFAVVSAWLPVLHLALAFLTLTFLMSMDQLFFTYPSVWVCLVFTHNWVEVVYFLQAFHGNDIVYFFVLYNRGHNVDMSYHPSIDQGHLVRWILQGYFISELPLFPYCR